LPNIQKYAIKSKNKRKAKQDRVGKKYRKIPLRGGSSDGRFSTKKKEGKKIPQSGICPVG